MSETLSNFSELNTGRCDVRRLRSTDADDLRTITDDPSITDIIDFLPTPFTQGDAESLIRGQDDGRDCFLGIWHREKSELIGVFGVHLCGTAEIEIGYWMAVSFRGQGYTTEAGAKVIRQAQDRFPSRRIFAECRPENTASWRVLEKLGFRTRGTPGARAGRLRLELS